MSVRSELSFHLLKNRNAISADSDSHDNQGADISALIGGINHSVYQAASGNELSGNESEESDKNDRSESEESDVV